MLGGLPGAGGSAVSHPAALVIADIAIFGGSRSDSHLNPNRTKWSIGGSV